MNITVTRLMARLIGVAFMLGALALVYVVLGVAFTLKAEPHRISILICAAAAATAMLVYGWKQLVDAGLGGDLP